MASRFYFPSLLVLISSAAIVSSVSFAQGPAATGPVTGVAALAPPPSANTDTVTTADASTAFSTQIQVRDARGTTASQVFGSIGGGLKQTLDFITTPFTAPFINTNAAAVGPGASGGGDAIAAQFAQVSQRAGEAIKSICMAALSDEKSPDSETQLCSNEGLGLLEGVIMPMAVQPRTRNSVKNFFGKPLDAKVDKNGILLDVDRWSDLENETNPAQMQAARRKQVTLALHMPLVFVGKERLDSNAISDELMNLLVTKEVSLDALVDGPASEALAPTSDLAGPIKSSPGAVAAQFYQIATSAYGKITSICAPLLQNPSDPRNADPNTIACTFMRDSLFTVVPEFRDSIHGEDGHPRDAGNNGSDTIYLDVDRWIDLQNETDPTQILAARISQVTLALHETLVLGHQEADDTYFISAPAINLLLENQVSFIALVGSPSILK